MFHHILLKAKVPVSLTLIMAGCFLSALRHSLNEVFSGALHLSGLLGAQM